MAIFNRCLLIMVLLVSVGCSNVSKLTSKVLKPYDKITIVADQNVNPDINQRPSPIKIKIYELTARTTMDNLNFSRAFYQGKVMLSDELLSEKVHVLQPGEELKFTIKPNKKTRFVALIAAYRNIDEVKWKHVYAIKPHGRYRHPFVLSDRGIVPGKVVVDKSRSDGDTSDEPVSTQADSAADKAKQTQGRVQDAADSAQKAGESVKGKVDGVTSPPDDIKQGVELINKSKAPKIEVPKVEVPKIEVPKIKAPSF